MTTLNDQQTKRFDSELITMDSQNQIKATSIFQQVLDGIPQQVKTSSALLADYQKDKDQFFKTINEKELQTILNDLQSTTKYRNAINKVKANIRNYFDDYKKDTLAQLDNYLNQYDFNKLENNGDAIKSLKKDLSAYRKDMKWNALEETFNAAVAEAPALSRYTPRLTVYSNFKDYQTSLVTGSKAQKVTNNLRDKVTNIIKNWNTQVENIIKNPWDLNDTSMATLLDQYEKDPNDIYINSVANNLKAKEDEALKQAQLLAQKRQEDEKRQEEKRLHQEQDTKDAAQKAFDPHKEIIEPNQQPPIDKVPQPRNPFAYVNRTEELEKQYPTLMKEIIYNPRFESLGWSDTTKADALYALISGFAVNGSAIRQELGSDLNTAAKSLIEIARFIVNLDDVPF